MSSWPILLLAFLVGATAAAAPRDAALPGSGVFEGGSPARSSECEAFSEHGYLGIETRVLDGVGDWIKAQGR